MPHDDFTHIKSLLPKLDKDQLKQLHLLIAEEYNKRLAQEIALKSQSFKKGDIVYFQHNNKAIIGIVYKINIKSISVLTIEGIQVNVSPTFLEHVKKPSKEILVYREEIFPSIIK